MLRTTVELSVTKHSFVMPPTNKANHNGNEINK